jgi:hypothetical protein
MDIKMDIKIERALDIIKTHTPYLASFVGAAKTLGGKWNSNEGIWEFPIEIESDVRECVREHYGTDGNDEMVLVKITAKNRHQIKLGPVEAFGQIIASARGRDSGAKVGNGVSMISGQIYSGGSVKNWETCIAAKTQFKLKVAKPIAISNDDWDLEIIPEVDIKSLRAERARLELRIQEINSILEN